MPKSPQLGYNHNIPHRGRLFHVQTEDSGRGKSHIYTHVFHDGTIIATNKVDYERPSDPGAFDEYVIGLMQASHKQLVVRLRKGEFDDKITLLLGEFPQASAPPQVVATESTAEEESTPPPLEVRADAALPPEPIEHELPAIDGDLD